MYHYDRFFFLTDETNPENTEAVSNTDNYSFNFTLLSRITASGQGGRYNPDVAQ